MKCAYCDLKMACSKEGRDCHGGTLELPEYKDPTVRPFVTYSAFLQHVYGNNLTRLQELIFISLMMRYKQLGLVYCAGMHREAQLMADALAPYFEVKTVCCDHCLGSGGELLHDPDRRFDLYARADRTKVDELNAYDAPMHVSMGLCIEQDILFNRHSRVPVTNFAVPDWVLGHHPLTVVNTSYQRKKYLQGKGLPKPGQVRRTRLQELILFGQRAGFKSISLGFCNGLFEESRMLSDILSQYFLVYSVCCKTSGIDKNEQNTPYINPGAKFESACNPVGQAKIDNALKVDLSVQIGICLGHDMTFEGFTLPPTTTFAPKDRVLGHNTLAALYSGSRAMDVDYHDPRPYEVAERYKDCEPPGHDLDDVERGAIA
ncbi:Uncharacterized metal-binding protein [Desulfotomaculum arcticum]|uniref:Uncharacterized metal-binding protein n=1 Tax=Desulfotruncus arcticus DSM 17038 TaxID=1121424 RepID=A0A1I2YQZ7_9FIRM|nr:DUF1847 domain-containing protein [Desulfotruncus arcticus]SFH27880.1 Uncharacterized metal-binding protein [Desulfotomaculum arcticum] [Desulfotruncus arcticus DSM 17038]